MGELEGIGWIVLSFGALYIFYQIGRYVKNEADLNFSLLIKKCEKLNISNDLYNMFERRFSTGRRLALIKYKDKDDTVNFENVSNIELQHELNRMVLEDIDKKKEGKLK